MEQLPKDVAELIVFAQSERVLITRDGRPYAIVVGVENKDAEDLELECSPAFWRMIEERRGSASSIPLKDFMAQLEAKEKSCEQQQAGTAQGPST